MAFRQFSDARMALGIEPVHPFVLIHVSAEQNRFLVDHLYDENDTPLSNIIDVQVSNLRKKFGSTFITTHRGLGYSIDT